MPVLLPVAVTVVSNDTLPGLAAIVSLISRRRSLLLLSSEQ
jgi:hypothetical protein